MSKPGICFVGLNNLPVLAREFGHHGMGGESVQHTLLARALHRRGYRVSMVVADRGQLDGTAWDGIVTHKAYAPTSGIPVLRFLHPRWTGLDAAMRRAEADIYYISCGGAAVGQTALHAMRHNRRMIFRIAHDGDCLKDDRERIRYWRDRRLYEYGLRRASVILAQTESQQERMRQNFGLESELAGMLVEGPQHNYSFLERNVAVLWVNNLRQFKRPDLALQLAQDLPEFSTHMIGGPVGGHEKLFEEIAARGRLISNLHFHGQVPYHDVNDYYEKARVFVNTSDSEGFPNSYLQAWARGTPVVAFFDPDHVIEREGLGRAVSSPEEMSSVVRQLATDPNLWEACSTRCRGYMARRFSEDRILAPYLRAFDSTHRGDMS